MATPFIPDPVVERLRRAVGGDAARVRPSAPLAPLTTFHVGGPADYLVEARSAERDRRVRATRRERWRCRSPSLGGGSNVLVSDAGVRGLVLLCAIDTSRVKATTGVAAGAGLTINGLVRWTVGQGLAGLEAWAGTPGPSAAPFMATPTSRGATSAT